MYVYAIGCGSGIIWSELRLLLLDSLAEIGGKPRWRRLSIEASDCTGVFGQESIQAVVLLEWRYFNTEVAGSGTPTLTAMAPTPLSPLKALPETASVAATASETGPARQTPILRRLLFERVLDLFSLTAAKRLISSLAAITAPGRLLASVVPCRRMSGKSLSATLPKLDTVPSDAVCPCFSTDLLCLAFIRRAKLFQG